MEPRSFLPDRSGEAADARARHETTPSGGPSSDPAPESPHGGLEPLTVGPVPTQQVGRRRTGGAVYLALFVVAVLGGSALFLSGFTLGHRQAGTPGTGVTLQDQFRPFWDAFDKIDREYVGEVERSRLIQGAIDGMFEAIGDPFSDYMTAEEYRDSLEGISGEFGGIGAELSTEDAAGEPCTPVGDGCRAIVVRTLDGSPAAAAGIQAGDEIVSVDDDPVEGETLEQIVLRVRGDEGTQVRLLLRRGSADPFELTITRAIIQTEAVRSEVLAEGAVGYLRITGFNSTAAEDFHEHLQRLIEQEEVRSIVLDLRDDPGGFVTAARTIASEFIGSGPIFYEETTTRRITHEAEPGGVATDPGIELLVLVNGGTASASEIVAGAIQDSGRGRLVGDTTYGKGTIQQWHLLPGDNGGFRLSVAKWLTPKERWIHGEGLEPDFVARVPEGTPAGEDPVLTVALKLLAAGPAASPAAPAPSPTPAATPSGSVPASGAREAVSVSIVRPLRLVA